MSTIVVDNSGAGSETQASGCGPTTAVYGTNGRVVTGLATRVLFSLSSELAAGVAANDVLYLGTGSTNRRFSKITVARTDYVTTSCSWTADDTQVGVGSISGINVGDVVLVNSGYYNVSVVSASTITCDGLDQSSSYSGTLVRYSQVTVEDSMTVGSGYTWAIGGKRAGLPLRHERRDAAPFRGRETGWVIDIAYTGTDYNIGTTTLTHSAVGDATTGNVSVTSSSATRPTLYTASNGVAGTDVQRQRLYQLLEPCV